MRKAITLLLFLIPSIFFGQETIRITNKKTNEVYYVLKSDTSIRQGIYKKWGWNDKSKIEGFYKNGVRDSIWSFYDTKGHIEQQYNFTKKETVFYIDLNPFKNTKSAIINGSDTTKVILDQSPYYLGGQTCLTQYISDYLKEQGKITACPIRGTAYIAFTISKSGKALDCKVLGNLTCLSTRAIMAVKTLPFEWIPGILNGEKVNTLVVLPIRYLSDFNITSYY